MPLPEILRRRSTSNRLSSSSSSQESRKRPQKLPLEGFDLKPGVTAELTNEGLHLASSLDDILERNVALGYFMQYLDAVGGGSLMKFWLDVTSFKSAFSVKDCTIVSCSIYFLKDLN